MSIKHRTLFLSIIFGLQALYFPLNRLNQGGRALITPMRWLWVLLAGIVILSTLFTGQHHFVGPIGGILWTFGGYYLAKTWQIKRRAVL